MVTRSKAITAELLVVHPVHKALVLEMYLVVEVVVDVEVGGGGGGAAEIAGIDHDVVERQRHQFHRGGIERIQARGLRIAEEGTRHVLLKREAGQRTRRDIAGADVISVCRKVHQRRAGQVLLLVHQVLRHPVPADVLRAFVVETLESIDQTQFRREFEIGRDLAELVAIGHALIEAVGILCLEECIDAGAVRAHLER